MTLSVTLIGCGKMGSALLSSWINNDIIHHANIVEPYGLPQQFSEIKNISFFKNIDALAVSEATEHIYILAIKPQIMQDVCRTLRTKTKKTDLILSIAAGQSISTLQEYFYKNQPVIRSMPNTPAAISKGMTVACASNDVTADQKRNAETLLSTTGLFEWIEKEEQINAITALSGSGPAYFFYLTEILAKTGQDLGLPKDLSLKLAQQTFIGSAALAEHDQQITPDILRRNVTSPGGTTEAALNILMKDDALHTLFLKALEAATKRGKELSN